MNKTYELALQIVLNIFYFIFNFIFVILISYIIIKVWNEWEITNILILSTSPIIIGLFTGLFFVIRNFIKSELSKKENSMLEETERRFNILEENQKQLHRQQNQFQSQLQNQFQNQFQKQQNQLQSIINWINTTGKQIEEINRQLLNKNLMKK